MLWPLDFRSLQAPFGPVTLDGMVEKDQIGPMLRQRPGYQDDLANPTPAFGAAPGGIGIMQDNVFVVADTTFYQVSGPATGTDGTSWMTDTVSAPWAGREYFDAVNFNGSIYIIGGQNNTSGSVQGDVWVSKDGGANWGLVTSSAPFGPRFGHRCVVFNGAIYLIGGWYGAPTGGVLANDVWMTQDGANWTQVNGGAASFPGRTFFGAVATDGGIYVMGGCTVPSMTIGGTGTNFNDVWFSADGATWNQLIIGSGTIWSARAGFDVIFYNGLLTLVGGKDCNTLTQNNECWTSPDGRTWTQATATALSIGANFTVRLVVYANKMWALGGHYTTDSSNVYSSTNPAVWSLVGNLPVAKMAGAACVAPVNAGQSAGLFETLFYIGGGVFGGGGASEVYNGAMNVTFTNAPLVGAVSGDAYQFELYKQGNCLLIKSIHGLWVFEHGVVTQVQDARYPPVTVPGIVVMGDYAYVMDPTGLIVNCDTNNPQYWPGQNFVGADYSGDGGVAIAKESNYLIAFGPSSTQWFYDAGIAVGSPLMPYLAANSRTGCVDGLSIQNIGGNLYWYGQDESGMRGIMRFNGTTGQVISPRAFNLLLKEGYSRFYFPSSTQALAISTETRSFYVYPCEYGIATGGGLPGSVVYDVTMNEWYLWTPGNNGAYTSIVSGFPFVCSAAVNPSTPSPSGHTSLMLSIRSFQIAFISDENFVDKFQNISFDIPTTVQTGIYDTGTNRMKFWGRQDIIGDQIHAVSGGTISVSVSDDDYESWYTANSIDMTTPRPASFRWGASRRRAFKLLWNTSNLLRIRGLEQQYSTGSPPHFGTKMGS
jgi:hypothetical protein